MTNNNNNYSWTKDFSAAVLLREQGIAPSPPARTTLGGLGGDRVTPAPHHCTPISCITPGTPQHSISLWGGQKGRLEAGGSILALHRAGGAGGAAASHLSPRQPLRSELDRRHTQTPAGVTEGGGSTSVPPDTTHSHAQTDSSTDTRPSRGALRAPGSVEASSSGRACWFGFVFFFGGVCCLVFFPPPKHALKAADFQAGEQRAPSCTRPCPPVGRELPIPVPPWGGSSPSPSPSLSPCPKPASSQRSQGRAAWVSALQ